MPVLFRNSQKAVDVQSDSVVKLAEFVLHQEDAFDKELSILFTDDAEITQLNDRYLGRNIPTDVLAFPMSGRGEEDPHPQVLGDVVVSVERAVSYAQEHRLTAEEEISLYLIHGLLHLLGYDDAPPRQSKIMRGREKELLREASERGLIISTQ